MPDVDNLYVKRYGAWRQPVSMLANNPELEYANQIWVKNAGTWTVVWEKAGGGSPSDKVPYTGAISDVNLGEFGLSAGQINFDTSPTGTPQVGTLVWNDTDGTLDLHLKGGNVTLQVGQEQLIRVVNGTGADLLESQYKVVRITGAQGQRPQVLLAQGNTEISSVDTIGLVTEDIANNQEGYITTSGLVREVNTSGSLQGETWLDGDPLYVSPTVAGGLTKVKPVAPNHSVAVGIVVHAHNVHGKIFVKVDNGYELEELHNVKIVSEADGELLAYDTAEGVWKNVDQSTIVAGNSDRIDGYHIQVDGAGTDPNTIYLKTTGGGFVEDKYYRHVQSAPSSIWTVAHNLGKLPSVFIIDSGGSNIEGDVTYTNSNSVVLNFSSAFAGEAIFN